MRWLWLHWLIKCLLWLRWLVLAAGLVDVVNLSGAALVVHLVGLIADCGCVVE